MADTYTQTITNKMDPPACFINQLLFAFTRSQKLLFWVSEKCLDGLGSDKLEQIALNFNDHSSKILGFRAELSFAENGMVRIETFPI